MESASSLKVSIQREFEAAALGDERLAKRLISVASELAKKPDASFPQLFDDSGLAATYRLFNNNKVTLEGLLAPHVRQTVERAGQHDEVLVAHDTTEFNFGTKQRQGLEYIGRGKSYGFMGHASLVIAPNETREPLEHRTG